jgi:large subunit ribosomal protein L28
LPTSGFFNIAWRSFYFGGKMARCELTGKSPAVKNLVSHSNIKTKSVSNPNVQQKRIFSRALNAMISLKMATSTIRSMEHMGGFDKFILNQPQENLSPRALAVKLRILRRLRGKKREGAKP